MNNKKLKLKIISGVFFALAFIGLFFFLFSGDNLEILKSLFTEDYTKEELKDRLRDFGIKGYITISILAMLQIIIAFLPAEPVQVLAGVTFGFIRGFAACMVGVLVGNTLI